MSTDNVIKYFGGFSIGYAFGLYRNKAEEIAQGQNEYLAIAGRMGEIECFNTAVCQVAEAYFKTIPAAVSLLCNVTTVTFLPFALLGAFVKQGQYSDAVAKLREIGIPGTKYLPDMLSPKVTRAISLLVTYTDPLIQGAFVVCIVALPFFGQYAFAGSVLGMLAFQEIDRRGWLPRKASLAAATYSPVVARIGFFMIAPTRVMQLQALLGLVTYIPAIWDFLRNNLDKIVRIATAKVIPGSRLADYMAPLETRKTMPFAEIMRILIDPNPLHYVLNPAHCSKPASLGHPLPEDDHFDEFLSLFDAMTWDYRYILYKLKEDEHFSFFLRDALLEQGIIVSSSELSNFDTCDRYIEQLACQPEQTEEEKKAAKQAYVIRWTRQQLEILVQVLKDERPIKGARRDIDAALGPCRQILAYLKTQPQDKQEGILVKLAVEGGNYCARGIKRTVSEIVDETVIPNGLPPPLLEKLDFGTNYEVRLRQALQTFRRDLIQEQYYRVHRLMERFLPNGVTNAIFSDVHGFDIYRFYLSLGFYPMMQLEVDSADFGSLLAWILYSGARGEMETRYLCDLDSVVCALGEVDCANYVQRIISMHPHLSDGQKTLILQFYEIGHLSEDEREEVRRNIEGDLDLSATEKTEILRLYQEGQLAIPNDARELIANHPHLLQVEKTTLLWFYDTIEESQPEEARNIVRQSLLKNPGLSQEEKRTLTELFQDNSPAQQINRRFHRLLLVMLGVLHYTPSGS